MAKDLSVTYDSQWEITCFCVSFFFFFFFFFFFWGGGVGGRLTLISGSYFYREYDYYFYSIIM